MPMVLRVIFIISLSLFSACSTERLAEVSKPRPSEAGRPAIPYSLEITPVDAYSNSILTPAPKGFVMSNAKIVWLVNDSPAVSLIEGQFKSDRIHRGDTVQAKALIQGQEIRSNSIIIKNSPPEINSVKIIPEIFKLGDALGVETGVSDADGDEVTVSYEWSKNNEPAGTESRINVPIKRGDNISVKITPYDGRDYGNSILFEREINNMPPMIVDSREFNFNGRHYSYRIKAMDPDGDALAYSLNAAPEGMTVDAATGLVQWDVPADVKERTEMKVVVTDGHGGQSEGVFYIIMTPEK